MIALVNEIPPEIHIEMKIKPLRFLQSLPYFGIALGLMIAMYYALFPIWIGYFGVVNGYFYSFIAASLTLFFIPFALFYYESDEENPATLKRFQKRFHLKKLTWQEWKWILITIVLTIPLTIGMGFLNDFLIRTFNISIPWSGKYEILANIDLLTPNGFQVIMMIVVLLVNIPAEELFFRGFLYPRQEVVHGKWTWIIHGLLWWGYQAYKWFRLPTFLVNSLLIPLLWHRTKNTTATMVSHFIGNAVSIAVGYILILFT